MKKKSTFDLVGSNAESPDHEKKGGEGKPQQGRGKAIGIPGAKREEGGERKKRRSFIGSMPSGFFGPWAASMIFFLLYVCR